MKCSICGNKKLNYLFSAKDCITGDNFSIRKCSECGYILTAPSPNPENIKKYYQELYYGNRKSFIENIVNYLRLGKISESLNANRDAVILDVGCGNGSFMASLLKQGWEAWGTEIAPESHFVDEKISSRIYRKEIKECNFPDNKFDIITMWHTLEHLEEPQDYLLEIKRILKRKGILVIELPNFDSLQAKLTKGNWFHLDVPRHLIHFTSRTLIACLESSDFSVLKISHFPLVYSIFGFIQSIINIFSGKKNMLFDLLNSKIKFRDIRNREIGLRDLLIVSLLIIPVSAIAIPLSFLEYLLKRGGVITLHAALRNSYKDD